MEAAQIVDSYTDRLSHDNARALLWRHDYKPVTIVLTRARIETLSHRAEIWFVDEDDSRKVAIVSKILRRNHATGQEEWKEKVEIENGW